MSEIYTRDRELGENLLDIIAKRTPGMDYTIQWQKLNNGSWTEIAGSVSDTLSIENAGSADKGTYRCRLNVLYFDNTAQKEYSISAYSPEINTVYSKRTPK